MAIYVLGWNKTDTVCIGQVAASLASLSRTVDDYSALSKKELIPAKQEKAFERVKNFREELGDYRQRFDQLRKEREDAVRFTGFTHDFDFENGGLTLQSNP